MRYLTLLLLFTASLFAADFKVESFDRADGDLTAIQANIKDVNDELCGQIRIFTEFTDLAFESSPSPMDVKKMTGEIRVFLTPGSKFIMFRKEGYKALRFVFPQKIEGGVSYRLNLGTTGAKLEDVAVSIITNPPGARVFIDNIDKGTDKQHKISIGSHDLRLVKVGYETSLAKITVSPDKTLFEYKLKEEAEVPIVINSTPAGAKVEIDGIKLGVTPLNEFYKSGKYKIILSKEGCDSYSGDIVIAAPKTVKDYTLKEAVGYLTINTHASAKVFINGKQITEWKKIKLEPQKVTVVVKMKKSADLEQSVIIKKDDNLNLDMYPEVATGTIQVSVTPDNAQVELKGEDGDVYTAVGSKSFAGLVVGEYKLTIKADGFKSFSETISLSAEAKVKKQVVMEKGSDVPYGFVFVQGGTFLMGSNDGDDDEKPIHSVTVPDFYIGKYEVTQKEWTDVIHSNPSTSKGDNLPVDNVNWGDIQAFIKKLNIKTGFKYRLPTEAEWEYACRGGNITKGYKYSGSNSLEIVGWYDDNSGDKAHPVGLKQANELGIYDMSGNVWEWCNDYYDKNYYTIGSKNLLGPTIGTYRVLRGGNYNYGDDYCRVADRAYSYPEHVSVNYNNMGFRLVCIP